MSYKNLKDRLDFIDTRIKIDDIEECKKYAQMLENKQLLPDNISYKMSYDINGNAYATFYKEATDSEIKTMIEISNAKSLKKTGDALNFFKILTIIGLITTGVIFLIGLIASFA